MFWPLLIPIAYMGANGWTTLRNGKTFAQTVLGDRMTSTGVRLSVLAFDIAMVAILVYSSFWRPGE